MKPIRPILAAFLSLLSITSIVQAQTKEPVDYVNPYIGNISHLLVPTFATVQLPNSMLRIYPARADYEDFKKCVIKNGFTYDRESEKYLKNLVKLAKFEGYYEDTKADFDNLEKKLSHNLSRDLNRNKNELKEIISKDIVTAYHFQSGAIQNTLQRDKQMKEALRLLSNPAEYKKILQPNK